jgi:hypothetical protein
MWKTHHFYIMFMKKPWVSTSFSKFALGFHPEKSTDRHKVVPPR